MRSEGTGVSFGGTSFIAPRPGTWGGTETRSGNDLIPVGKGKNVLDTTGLYDGHPFSSTQTRLAHQYPNPKAYTDKAEYFGNTHQVYEELSNMVKSYHHRYKDPLAFENRHRDVYTAAPNAFRRPKGTSELRCATSSMWGNPLTKLPHIMRPRTKQTTPAGVSQSQMPYQQNVLAPGDGGPGLQDSLLASQFSSMGGRQSPTTLGLIPEEREGAAEREKDGVLRGASNMMMMQSSASAMELMQQSTRKERLNKSQSLPKMKRPRWTRLAKTNIGFPSLDETFGTVPIRPTSVKVSTFH